MKVIFPKYSISCECELCQAIRKAIQISQEKNSIYTEAILEAEQ